MPHIPSSILIHREGTEDIAVEDRDLSGGVKVDQHSVLNGLNHEDSAIK